MNDFTFSPLFEVAACDYRETAAFAWAAPEIPLTSAAPLGHTEVVLESCSINARTWINMNLTIRKYMTHAKKKKKKKSQDVLVLLLCFHANAPFHIKYTLDLDVLPMLLNRIIYYYTHTHTYTKGPNMQHIQSLTQFSQSPITSFSQTLLYPHSYHFPIVAPLSLWLVRFLLWRS